MEDGGVEGWMVGVECESGQVRDGVHGEGGGWGWKVRVGAGGCGVHGKGGGWRV